MHFVRGLVRRKARVAVDAVRAFGEGQRSEFGVNALKGGDQFLDHRLKLGFGLQVTILVCIEPRTVVVASQIGEKFQGLVEHLFGNDLRSKCNKSGCTADKNPTEGFLWRVSGSTVFLKKSFFSQIRWRFVNISRVSIRFFIIIVLSCCLTGIYFPKRPLLRFLF